MRDKCSSDDKAEKTGINYQTSGTSFKKVKDDQRCFIQLVTFQMMLLMA